MPNTVDLLRLELVLPEPGHRSPAVALLDQNGDEHGRIPTAEPKPRLPFGDASIRSALVLDVLEHVHDEQSWLAELSRVLVPRGEITVRVPLENLTAWADALNIYRYVSDVTGRGTHPLESIPTGWHRHYAKDEVPALLELAGFEPVVTFTQGLPLEQVPYLAGLVIGKVVLRDHGSERRLFRLLGKVRNRPRLRLPAAIATSITVRARKTGTAYRPDPDLNRDHRPELETEETLE